MNYKPLATRYLLFAAPRGQSMVEIAILLPILVLVFCFIVDTSNFVITKQQLLSAARYGTDLIVHCNFNEEQVKEELTNYLTDENEEGRRLSSEGLNFKININTFPTINQWSRSGNHINLSKELMLSSTNVLMKHNAEVVVEYKTKIFPWIAKITGEDYFSIVARSEVFDGTGSKNNHS